MTNNSVTFGGVDIATVSPALKIIDVSVGGVEREISTLNPPASDGQIFGSAKNGTRAISIVLDINEDSMEARAASLRRLNMILSSKVPLPLRIPDMPGKYINAICTAFPMYSARDWFGELTINMIAHDPYFYADEGNMDVTLTAGAATNFYTGCSGPVRPVIAQTIASALTDPSWTDSKGDYIVLQGSVGVGALVIDCEAHRVTLAGVDIMTQLSLDSTFFEYDPNPADLFAPYTMTCANGAAGSMTGKYRWL